MAEKGIDIAAAKAKGVFALFKEGRTFSHVIAVCDAEAAQRCPIFPGVCEKLVWSFEDPSAFEGSDEAVMAQVRRVRDAIETRVREFLDQPATKG
jgi:arsenate reductase